MVNCDTLNTSSSVFLDDLNSHEVGVEETVTHPSKTFKIHPMFRMLYQSSIDVVSDEKSPLTKALLEKEIGKEKLKELQKFDFNELIVHMINELKSKVQETSYDDVTVDIRLHERYFQLQEIYKRKNNSNNLIMLSFRIPDYVIDEVYKLKKTTLGEVIELAIGLYVTTCEELIYDLICLAFENYEL